MARKEGFEISSRALGEVWIVDLGGEIDLYGSSSVRKKFEEVLKTKPKRFLVNLKKVFYMDSSGLATLIEAFQISRKQGIFFGIFGLNSQLQGLFEVTRLDKVFSIFQDEKEAIK